MIRQRDKWNLTHQLSATFPCFHDIESKVLASRLALSMATAKARQGVRNVIQVIARSLGKNLISTEVFTSSSLSAPAACGNTAVL